MIERFAIVALGAALLGGCATQIQPDGVGQGLVPLQILAINDFHGNLETPSGGFGVPDPANPGQWLTIEAGGAEHLATALAARRLGQPNTIMVAAGDLVGASPLISGLFHDEPAIESLSAMGLALSSVGNHEFDEGAAELRRLQDGGCHPVTGCQGPRQFDGAGFQYLAASTIDRATGRTVFPPYAVRTFGGVPVAVIGLTLEGTPSIISPQWAAQLEFRDEAETVNALVPQLRAEGVEAIVVLIHEGGENEGGPQDCAGFAGPIVDIVDAFDPAVDIVISGHTHQAYVCEIDGRLLTSGGHYGMAFTAIEATLDPATRDFASASAENIVAAVAEYGADPAQTALLAGYRAAAEPLMNRQVGAVTAPLSRSANEAGESALGDIIADAQLAAAPGARIAFMNPGGIREDIDGAPDRSVTYNDIYTAQPFGNVLTTLTMTGADIDALLEQQFHEDGGGTVLQVSAGFAYVWDGAAPLGAKVGAITLDGAPLDPAAEYRVVANNFLAGGGDGFTVFARGRDVQTGISDVEALEIYFRENSPVAPGPQDRIRRVD